MIMDPDYITYKKDRPRSSMYCGGEGHTQISADMDTDLKPGLDSDPDVEPITFCLLPHPHPSPRHPYDSCVTIMASCLPQGPAILGTHRLAGIWGSGVLPLSGQC
jgi:hypothetical protein